MPAAVTECHATETEALSQRLEALDDLASRVRIIASAVPGRLAFSTSLGLEDQAIMHAIVESGTTVDVFTLDTGRLFPETIELLEVSERHFGQRIRVLAPIANEVEDLITRDGVLGFRSSIEARKACCEVRKVRPLRRGLVGARGWITGLRRGQSGGRADVAFASWDEDHRLLKVNPLADWSLEDIEAYVTRNNIPVNTLHAHGFPSIGCQPCTRAIRSGEDIRAGRWWWENEDGKECGLHNRPKSTERRA